MPRILVVDDNEVWREGLADFLLASEFSVDRAVSGEDAIERINKQKPDLIISDLLMPGIDGFELCRRVRDSKPTADIPFIFCSGFFPEKEQGELASLLGVTDFFDKPVDFKILLDAVRRNLKEDSRFGSDNNESEAFPTAHKDLIQSKLWSAVDLERKQREIAENLAYRLEKNLEAFVSTVSKAVGARDPYTAGHQKRVASLAVAIAEVLGLSESQVTGLRLGGMIHDIGKIHIPAEILSKPARLSEIEFAMIKSHTNVGYEILNDIDFPWPIAQMAYQHHERLDGSGYPNGISGDEIILEAKIIAVADVIEAMASHRPYRAALGLEAAIDEVKINSGILYDPKVVDAYLQIAESFSFE